VEPAARERSLGDRKEDVAGPIECGSRIANATDETHHELLAVFLFHLPDPDLGLLFAHVISRSCDVPSESSIAR